MLAVSVERLYTLVLCDTCREKATKTLGLLYRSAKSLHVQIRCDDY